MNPLRIFFAPRATIREAYRKPSLPAAFLLVLSPAVFLLLVFLFYGIAVDWVVFAAGAIKELIFWVAGAVTFYILLYVLKGKKTEGKFSGILTAFSFLYLVRLAIAVVFLAMVVLSAPALMPKLSSLQNVQLTPDQFMAEVSSIPYAPDSIVFALVVLTLLITLLLVVFALFVLYQIIAQAAPGSRAKNLVVLFLQIGFLVLIQSVL